MSNFWGRFFHVFGVKKFLFNFFENMIASALKSCMINYYYYFYFFAPENMKKPPSKVARNPPPIFSFCTGPAAQTAQKQKSRTPKTPLMQDWILRLGLTTNFNFFLSFSFFSWKLTRLLLVMSWSFTRRNWSNCKKICLILKLKILLYILNRHRFWVKSINCKLPKFSSKLLKRNLKRWKRCN